MNQGKIIEYIDQGKFVCSICIQDKGNRLHLLTPWNREVNLSVKRAFFISGTSVDTLRPREELLEKLRKTEELRNTLSANVDVKELWELINGEKESFDHKYLAQLCFGEVVTDDHFSALIRALFEDRVHFKMKDARFLPNSVEKVEQILKQREEQAVREERLRKGSSWLKEVKAGRASDAPECKEDIIQLLIQLALYGKDAPDFKHGKEMLSKAGINYLKEARILLIKLGLWEEDENLDLLRLDIRTTFSQRIVDESDRLSSAEISIRQREDLRHLSAFTIDGPLTQDFDDALSFEKRDDGIHVGVHIADVASTISKGSVVDSEAELRSSSLYLQRKQVPMIPTDLSQGLLSLIKGADRPAISLLAHFDNHGDLLSYRFSPSVIRVQRQLTYDYVNESLENEKPFNDMFQISQRLRRKRMDSGGLNLSLPEIEIEFDNSSISLRLVEQDTPSRALVAEFMILYNHLSAQFSKENEIPILYRTQAEPSERLSVGEAGYLYFVFQQRRKLYPLKVNTSPGPHSGLGLDVYTNASSPIRRYLDLVMQRQLSDFLMGDKLTYSVETLEEKRMATEPILRNLALIRRNRTRYWVLKFLSQNIGKRLNAIVLDVLKTKYRIVLSDLLMIGEIKRKNGVALFQGQPLLVEVKKSDPWDDVLELTYVGS